MKYFRRTAAPTESQTGPEQTITEAETSHAAQGEVDASRVVADETEEQVKASEPEASILSEDDEAFLKRVASGADAPLPSFEPESVHEGHIPSAAFLTPLPDTPSEESGNALDAQKPSESGNSWSYKSLVPSNPFPTFRKSKDTTNAAPPTETKAEEAKESRDISTVLKGLNLSTFNNRVVSLSEDSKKLVHQFNLILRDIVMGVPTAYDDLEKFLTQRHGQIEKLYKAMPPFIQALIVSLPAKILSASPSKPSASTQSTQATQSSSKEKSTKKSTSYIPTLRNLIAQKGAIAGMLQSTVTFLETRFPAVLAGTNVLMSLAVFILMFVFWYCHKRGKETRLAKEDTERLSAGEDGALASDGSGAAETEEIEPSAVKAD